MNITLPSDKLFALNPNKASANKFVIAVIDKNQSKINGRAISTLNAIHSALRSNAQVTFADELTTDICAVANTIFERYEKRYNESWWQSIVDTFTRCFDGVTELEKINEIRNQILSLSSKILTADELSSSCDSEVLSSSSFSGAYSDSSVSEDFDIINLPTDFTNIKKQVIPVSDNHNSEIQSFLQNKRFSIFDNSHFEIPTEIFYAIFSFCCFEDMQALSLCSRTIHNMTDTEPFYKSFCVKQAKIEIVPTQIWKKFFEHKDCYYDDIESSLKTITETRLSLTQEYILNQSTISIRHGLLGSVPFEIFINIFSYCNGKDLVKFSTVSVEIYNSKTVSRLWQSFCIKEAPGKMNLVNTTWKNFCKDVTCLPHYTGNFQIAIQCWGKSKSVKYNVGVNFEKATIGHLKKIIIIQDSTWILSEMKIIVGGTVPNDKDKAGECWKSIAGGCGRTHFYLFS